MLKPSLDYLRTSKSVNLIMWVAVTVFLGALGSGLWETVVSPVFSFLGGLLVQLLSQVSEAYSDSLHSRIGRDGVYILSRLPQRLAFFVLMLSPWALVMACDILLTKSRRLVSEIERSKAPQATSVENREEKTNRDNPEAGTINPLDETELNRGCDRLVCNYISF
jgi:hypothetical protein